MTEPRRTWAALLGVALLYVGLALVLFPHGTYWLTDIGNRYLQAANVRFTPGLDLAYVYPGRWLDPDLQFVPFNAAFYFVHQGRLLTSQPAIIAILSQPFLKPIGPLGGLVVPIAAGVVCAGLAGILTHQLVPHESWLGILLTGLATPILIYSLAMWEHTLAVALGLGAALLVLKSLSDRSLVWSGLLSAAAGAMRKEMLLFGLALAGMVVVSALFADRKLAVRRVLLWVGAFVAVVGLYGLISFSQTGNIVPPEFRISVRPSVSADSYLVANGPAAAADFFFDADYGPINRGLMLMMIVYGLANWIPNSPTRAVTQLAALTVIGVSVWNLTVWPLQRIQAHGLLATSPFLVLGLTGLRNSTAQKLQWLLLGFVALVILNLSLLSQAGPNQGGEEPGPRFLLAAFPLAVPLAVAALRELWTSAVKSLLARIKFIVALELIVMSVAMELTNLDVSRQATEVNYNRSQVLLRLPEQQILTDESWLAMLTPDAYLTKEIFLTNTTQEFSYWVAQARAEGVETFAWVGEGGPPLPGELDALGVSRLSLEPISNDFVEIIHFKILPLNDNAP